MPGSPLSLRTIPHWHVLQSKALQTWDGCAGTWLFITYEWDSMAHCLKHMLTCTPGSTGLGCHGDGKLYGCTGSQLCLFLLLSWEHSEQQWYCWEGVVEGWRTQPHNAPLQPIHPSQGTAPCSSYPAKQHKVHQQLVCLCVKIATS